MRAARVTRALGPQLSRLRERHAGDPRRLAAESAALHRRHGVSPGMIVIVIPWLPTAPPYTHGLPCFTATSLIR